MTQYPFIYPPTSPPAPLNLQVISLTFQVSTLCYLSQGHQELPAHPFVYLSPLDSRDISGQHLGLGKLGSGEEPGILKTEGAGERVPLPKLALVFKQRWHGTARFLKREKATNRLEFLEAGAGVCAPHPPSQNPFGAALVSPLPIFGLLLVEPAPQPRPRSGRGVDPAAVPCRWPPSPGSLPPLLHRGGHQPGLSAANFGFQFSGSDAETWS